MKKRVLIFGITGQIAFYLAEFLLKKDYEVYGVYRRTSLDIGERLNPLIKNIKLIEGDITDADSVLRAVKESNPDEIYNLAAQSHVPSSWSQPISTGDITGLGVVRILEAIRIVNPKIKFYQSSSSELFGKVQETPQKETTRFYPRSPYAAAKAYGYYITINYRESYGIFACNGILFNTESPKRPKQFVTRKISNSVAKIKLGKQEYFEIGNIDSKRDWEYAEDAVRAMWLMMQQDKPEDFVISTGKTYSVREFIEEAFKVVNMNIKWEGEGVNELGKVKGKVVVRINPKFYRPTEVDLLVGDYSNLHNKTGWKPKTTFPELVKMMVDNDIAEESNGK